MKKDFLSNGNIPPPGEEQIAVAVRAGQEYMQTHIPKRNSLLRLFVEQVKYLSPLLWVVQLLAIFLVCGTVFTTQQETDRMQEALFRISPLLSVLAVPELLKDVHFQMSELEASCKNRGSTVLLLRLLAVGMGNTAALLLLAGITAGASGQGFWVLLLLAVTPYNAATVLGLFLVRVFGLKTRASTLAVSLVSFVAVTLLPGKLVVASQIPTTVLAVAWGITLALLSLQAVQLWKDTRKGAENSWNFE